ncbi:MAG: hypothetical protein FWG10_04870 [Eubacteriaceae bacterium]|nr:hypothetical protein [Eubacteriaceae bacterium]
MPISIDIDKIAIYLDSRCTLSPRQGSPKQTGLEPIHKTVFNNKSFAPKEHIVEALATFYANKKNIRGIWDSLTEIEREFLTPIVHTKGKEFLPTTIETTKRHNLSFEFENSWGQNTSVLDNCRFANLIFLHLLEINNIQSKAPILFPNGREMPWFVVDALDDAVGKFQYEYTEYVPNKKDIIICREGRLSDFAALTRLAASERFKAKPKTYDITKAKLAKMPLAIGFDEVCDRDGKFCSPKEARRNNDFKVALPMFLLAANSGLLDIDSEGDTTPGKESADMLSWAYSELAKIMLQDYMRSDMIYELAYVTYIRAYDGNSWIQWPEARQSMLSLLKPVQLTSLSSSRILTGMRRCSTEISSGGF